MVSPDPLARCLPSGEKATARMDSVWPVMEAEHLATGLTLKMAWGWYTTFNTDSTDALCLVRWVERSPASSVSSM